ncbi:D-2-hydroxyacid dehydrogenase [Salinadaptatus halalkaliphilus]|uniref:D-2-hydroxyacid dehydrogenase n=1 Tax=Salinadaptatus halalkaliphilus TaxID=2419781 RepID=A0A4S3TL29_9EURY|nr:D-2-hydroxyacid dehydrogenase [Salinadaptatus halalkaliphilus]THE63943.1 D-2-hydroxyacid dehydrogenase [Salinadaptatus halalkaliphilus]
MTVDLERIGVHESVERVFPPDELRSYLQDLPPAVDIVDDAAAADCDAVVTIAYREQFLACDWIHSIQAGVDRFPFGDLEDHGVVLTNSTGIHDRTIGETVAGYLLAFARRLHRHVANQQERSWNRPAWDEAFTLPGTTACVVGTGTLGKGVANVVGSLGVDIVGVRRSADPVPGFDEIYATEDLLEAVADADFVIVTVPLTDDTHHLVDETILETMREDAYLVNVARGAVVDQSALIDAIEHNVVAGAALDVFETEPLPEESPLWGMDEVIVTPHCGAFTRDYFRDAGDIVRENVERLESDEAVHNRVV